jgi:hypothetical protein
MIQSNIWWSSNKFSDVWWLTFVHKWEVYAILPAFHDRDNNFGQSYYDFNYRLFESCYTPSLTILEHNPILEIFLNKWKQ